MMADDVKNEDGRSAASGDETTREGIERFAVQQGRTRAERIGNLSQAPKAFLGACPDAGTVTEVRSAADAEEIRRAGLALAQGGGT